VAEDWDVDIISLSFGFADDKKAIHDAIIDAEKDHSIMFFAAANNDGRNEPEMFPASMETVISIRGTFHDGSFDPQYNPKSSKYGPQYGSLARDVPCGWTSDSLTKSGCSIATPIVAAIAGLIISFVDREDSMEEYRDLVRTRKGMISIFSMMSDERQASRLELAPWQLYERHRSPKYLIGHALSNT
jgi:subtilisin family serine protease